MISSPGCMPDEWCFRAYVDARLDDLAAWDAEILAPEIGAVEAGRLRRYPIRVAAVFGGGRCGRPGSCEG
jgi:hypothetical protein